VSLLLQSALFHVRSYLLVAARLILFGFLKISDLPRIALYWPMVARPVAIPVAVSSYRFAESRDLDRLSAPHMLRLIGRQRFEAGAELSPAR